jgi:hypothetical protein
MSNAIKVYRPINRINRFDADSKADRELIFKHTIPTIKKERFSTEAAEFMFHITNAPDECLNDDMRAINTLFRVGGNYSISTGDVVEVDGTKFLCDSVGWIEIS